MATKLQELQEQIEVKSKELDDIFVKYPDMDMDATVAADIKKRNDELTDLGKKRNELKSLTDIAEKNRQAIGDGNERKSMPFPGKPGDARPALAKERKSPGQLFVESKAFTEFSAAGKRGPAAEVELKVVDETAFAPQAVRIPLVLPYALQRPTVADLIPSGQTDQIAVVYMEETTSTANATARLENADATESAIAFTEKSASVIEIATYLAISERLMEDAPAMRSYVDGRLGVFMQIAEEVELLSGSGTLPHMRGLLNGVGLQTQAKGTDPTPDAIYKAMTKIQVGSFLSPDGIVMHPNDWQDIALLRTADGIYIWGSPSGAQPERIWALPVVKTTAATENTALLGAYGTATQIFRRRGLTFEVSNSHNDYFIKGKLAIRCSERLAMPIYRPSAFCTVTGI